MTTSCKRIAEFLPGVISAQQRTHLAYAVPSELQRHTGAGGFVRSSAEEDDLAVARNFAVDGLSRLFGRNAQRVGQGVRIGQQIEGVTQVDDHYRLTQVELDLQFLRGDAIALHLIQEAHALIVAVADVGDESADEEQQRPRSQTLQVLRDDA